MNNAEMKITRFDAADVIATSGCNGLSADWSAYSYKATSPYRLNNGVRTDTKQCFVNGSPQGNDFGDGVLDIGNYYHYNAAEVLIIYDGREFATNFWLCTNDDHKQ